MTEQNKKDAGDSCPRRLLSTFDLSKDHLLLSRVGPRTTVARIKSSLGAPPCSRFGTLVKTPSSSSGIIPSISPFRRSSLFTASLGVIGNSFTLSSSFFVRLCFAPWFGSVKLPCLFFNNHLQVVGISTRQRRYWLLFSVHPSDR